MLSVFTSIPFVGYAHDTYRGSAYSLRIVTSIVVSEVHPFDNEIICLTNDEISLSRPVALSSCLCVVVSLCRRVSVSPCRCVTVSLCLCVPMSLCLCVVVWPPSLAEVPKIYLKFSSSPTTSSPTIHLYSSTVVPSGIVLLSIKSIGTP